MNEYRCIIKKDFIECLRTGKLILFLVLGLGIAIFILGVTALFSDIPDFLEVELPGLDIASLEDMMTIIYPKMLKESLGVFSYYIGIFYSLIIILVTHGILPKERKKGKWILPIEQGYSARALVTGKTLVYATLSGAAVFISYLIYFAVAGTFMKHNMTLGNAFMCGMIHGLNIFLIVSFTMLMSVCFKSSIVAVISVLGSVLFVPDIMNYLPIGKYFPTYMLTFVYESRNDYGSLLGPLVINLILLVITYYMAVIKVSSKK